VLAWELAAFPAEDEPLWEEMEYLEYLDDTAPQDAHPRNTSPVSTSPVSTSPDATDPVSATSADLGGADAGDEEAGTVFAHSGTADVMPPGPVLAQLADRAWQNGLHRLDDDELTGFLQAANRLGAWAAALKLSAVSTVVARREAAARADRDWRPFEHVDDEIAVALTLTRWSAGNVLDLAVALDRLSLIREALAAGQIDERRAAVIADELSGLGDEHAAAVEASIVGKAPGQTTSELRAAARQAVIAADPAAAKRRKDKALKDARVQAFTEPAGTAGLSGRDLLPAGVLAADKNLTALAEAMKKSGATGTMDQLRACVYLHLLSGQPVETLLARAAPGAEPPGAEPPGAEPPGTGNPGPSHPSIGTPSPETTGTTRTGTTGTTSGTGATRSAGPADGTAGPADGTAGPADGTAGPADGTAGDSDCGHADMAPPGNSAPDNAPRLGLPALRGTVNLTMPLASWLGWSQAPGNVPGFGPVDADDARTLADLLTDHRTNRWCITLTDRAGQPIAHGCAKTGPGSRTARTNTPVDPRAGPMGAPEWIRSATITPLQTHDCTHPRETGAYQISPALRHLIQIRQATCSHPGCRWAATRCDMDHTIPYHLGGRSCECNISPVCRRHHATKQAPGWALTQDKPGSMTWTTPGGRSYTTAPTCYPA